jgi:hypothetical protein
MGDIHDIHNVIDVRTMTRVLFSRIGEDCIQPTTLFLENQKGFFGEKPFRGPKYICAV